MKYDNMTFHPGLRPQFQNDCTPEGLCSWNCHVKQHRRGGHGKQKNDNAIVKVGFVPNIRM